MMVLEKTLDDYNHEQTRLAYEQKQLRLQMIDDFRNEATNNKKEKAEIDFIQQLLTYYQPNFTCGFSGGIVSNLDSGLTAIN
jgi:hypothetical protein